MTTSMIATAMDTLPSLIDRAAAALTGARDSAEVLEARDLARAAYDAARLAGRMARAKEAHDAVIAAVYRAQADAAVIEARAKIRLADEYDAAQSRGEVAGHGGARNFNVDEHNVEITTADLGLRHDEIHDARQLRDAEAASPGRIRAAADAVVARGEEPTKAAIRREVAGHGGARNFKLEDVKLEITTADPIRRELARMTREALEDEVIGLRQSNAELRTQLATQSAEMDRLREDLSAFSQGDMGRALGNAQRLARTAEGRMKEYQATAARADRRAKILEAEVAQLRAMVEAQEIPL